MSDDVKLEAETIQFAVKTMQLAYGALSVVVTEGNRVDHIMRRIEITIDKLTDTDREKRLEEIMQLIRNGTGSTP